MRSASHIVPPIGFQDVIARAMRSAESEVDVMLPRTSGVLPSHVRGVLMRNGPGRSELFGHPYDHPFDGDGMVTRFALDPADGGRVRYRNRYVMTRELRAEMRAGRSLFRSFGTNRPGGVAVNALRMRFKNAANTSVVWHGGKLLALWEGGLPHELAFDSLATIGRWDYHKALRGSGVLERIVTPELPFSAHPKRDPSSGELFNFGMVMGPRPRLALYRINDRGVLTKRAFLGMDRLSFVHDFVLTERFLVFFMPAVRFNIPRTLLGLKSPAESLEMEDAPMRVWFIDRETFELAHELEAEKGFVFHFANGFDDGRQVVVDAYRLNDFPSVDVIRAAVEGAGPIPLGWPERFHFDLERGSVAVERLAEKAGELPHTDLRYAGKRHGAIWAATTSGDASPGAAPTYLNTIQRIDTEDGGAIYRNLEPLLVGEPIFVPRSFRANDGSILVLAYDPRLHRSELLVLDARTLETQATFGLPHHVPPGFHGTWIPAHIGG